MVDHTSTTTTKWWQKNLTLEISIWFPWSHKNFNLSLHDTDLTRLIIFKVDVNLFHRFFSCFTSIQSWWISVWRSIMLNVSVFFRSFRFGARWLSFAIKSIHSFFLWAHSFQTRTYNYHLNFFRVVSYRVFCGCFVSF